MKYKYLAFGLALFMIFVLGCMPSPAVNAETEKTQSEWDTEIGFDSQEEAERYFSAYFVSDQNNRRADKLEYSWKVEDGVLTRTNQVNPSLTTSNVAILTFMQNKFADFEMSVDYCAGEKTGFWPVIGVRQQIPGKYYATPGGGAGIFMSQEGKITLWGPIVTGNIMANLYEQTVEFPQPYYGKTWHNMRIRCEGSLLSVWVDETPVYASSVATTDYFKGYISLQSVNNDCSFDNFKIRSLDTDGSAENEENKYEPTPETPAAAPAAESSYAFDLSAAGDFCIPVQMNGGLVKEVLFEGKPLNFNHYYFDYRSLTLRSSFIRGVGIGEYGVQLATDYGNCEFTVRVNYGGLTYVGAERVFTAGNEDLVVGVAQGSKGIDSITVNGTAVSEENYRFSADRMIIERAYLSALENGAYFWQVRDKAGNAEQFTVLKGIEKNEVFDIDFDNTQPRDNAWFVQTPASAATWQIVSDGIFKNSAKVRVNTAATLLMFGLHGNLNYAFHSGTYVFSMQFKPISLTGKSTVADLLMPLLLIDKNGGNIDMCYLRYSEEKGVTLTDDRQSSTLTYNEATGVYTITCRFEFDMQEHQGLNFPLWMSGELLIDNVRLYPVQK